MKLVKIEHFFFFAALRENIQLEGCNCKLSIVNGHSISNVWF